MEIYYIRTQLQWPLVTVWDFMNAVLKICCVLLLHQYAAAVAFSDSLRLYERSIKNMLRIILFYARNRQQWSSIELFQALIWK